MIKRFLPNWNFNRPTTCWSRHFRCRQIFDPFMKDELNQLKFKCLIGRQTQRISASLRNLSHHWARTWSTIKSHQEARGKRYNPGGYIEGDQTQKDPWDEDLHTNQTAGMNIYSLARQKAVEMKDVDTTSTRNEIIKSNKLNHLGFTCRNFMPWRLWVWFLSLLITTSLSPHWGWGEKIERS